MQDMAISGASKLEHVFFNQDDRVFVEFGSGRGQLTYWIVKATKAAKNVRYILVDKESHRHKFDNKLKDEVPEAEVQRIRADIQNLVLEKVPGVENESSVS
jgi:Methyltransferase TRM13